jgi:regulator of replication initiation timing
MSNLEENARLSHELEEARDTIEGLAGQASGLKKALVKALNENCELRGENHRLSWKPSTEDCY